MTEKNYFGRSYRIGIGDVEVKMIDEPVGLRVTFDVERDKSRFPNTAELTIANLSEKTREHLETMAAGRWAGLSRKSQKALLKSRPDLLAEQGITVKIEAGWAKDVQPVFLGALRECSSYREGATWITKAAMADGEKHLKLAMIYKSFPKGTPVASVLSSLADALKIGKGNVDRIIPALGRQKFSVLQGPLVLVGPVAEELDDICRSCGLEWSIQDGVLQVAELGEAANVGGKSPNLSPSTGLIGTVDVDSDGIVSGACLLRPDLIPGRAFRIDCKKVTGNFRCLTSKHTGDSHASGANWQTTFTGDPL